MGSNERPDVLFDSFRLSIDQYEFGESLPAIRQEIFDQYIAYSRKALAEFRRIGSDSKQLVAICTSRGA